MHPATALACLVSATCIVPLQAQATPILFADQTRDQVILAGDRNGDGDANDPGETTVFFDAANASGLTAPTTDTFTMTQSGSGSVYIGDGTADAVFRLHDRDGDNSAQGAGEAQVWFSADNAAGLPLLTPNGLAEGPDGAIYVVEADTVGTPNGDRVYRTQDLNGDGDANDPGEATIWLDLKALSDSSSPFEIAFDGAVAYIIDSNGTGPNLLYRAQDLDGDGQVGATEVTLFADETIVPLDFAMDAAGGDVFTMELLDPTGTQSLYRLTDMDGDGTIGALDSVTEVWNGDAVPAGTSLFAAFSVAVFGDELLVTSNGSTAESDAIFHLADRNGDGDYLDSGETASLLLRADNGSLPERARAAIFYAPTGTQVVPLPASALGLLAGLGLLMGTRGRLRRPAQG